MNQQIVRMTRMNTYLRHVTRVCECRLEVVKDDVCEKPMTDDAMIREPRYAVRQFDGQYADVRHHDDECHQQDHQCYKYLRKQKSHRTECSNILQITQKNNMPLEISNTNSKRQAFFPSHPRLKVQTEKAWSRQCV